MAAAPGHVEAVRHNVLDPLSREQVELPRGIGDALLTRLDPDGRMTAVDDPRRGSTEEVPSRDGGGHR